MITGSTFMDALGTAGVVADLPRKQNRARQACTLCRKRKVRCNLAEQKPCSNCVSSNQSCNPASSTFDGASQVSRLPPSVFQSPRSTETETQRLPPIEGNGWASDSHHSLQDRSLQPPVPGRSIGGPYGPDQSRPVDGRNQEHTSGLHVGRAGADSTSPSTGAATNASLTADDEIWSRNLQEMSNPGPEESTSARNGVGYSPSSSVSQQYIQPRKRVKFSGETLAHSMLPVMNGHAEISAMSGKESASRISHAALRSLSAPTSRRPCGKAPWINSDCQAQLDLLTHLPREDQYYLYTMKRAFSFPQRSVSDHLVRVFFESVYPLYPIFDRRDILRRYENLYSRQESSPLLFHSLFFSACQFADEHVLRDAGFTDVLEARIYFFQRAKSLYSYDCEPDHLVVVQSLILLSFWWMDYTEEKDMKYWITCAVNLALTMGMHKTLPKSLSVSRCHRKLWRRLFWVLYSREHQVATALGQPFMLHLKDCDVERLSEADFEDEADESPPLIDQKRLDLLLPKQSSCHPIVTLKHVELTIHLEELVTSLQEAESPREALEKLHTLKDITSPLALDAPVASLGDFSIDSQPSWTRENVGLVYLHLYHERIATFYYRSVERAILGLKRNGAGRGTCDTESDRWPATSSTSSSIDLKTARTAIVSSAERVFRTLSGLSSLGLLRYAPSNVSTTVFHSFLALTEEIINNPEGSSRHEHAKTIFHEGLRTVQGLRKYWSAASWCYNLYSNLAEHNFESLRPTSSQAINLSRTQSRFASRQGSPSITDHAEPMWDVDFLDPVLYLHDTLPFSFDPFGDWPTVGTGYNTSTS